MQESGTLSGMFSNEHASMYETPEVHAAFWRLSSIFELSNDAPSLMQISKKGSGLTAMKQLAKYDVLRLYKL